MQDFVLHPTHSSLVIYTEKAMTITWTSIYIYISCPSPSYSSLAIYQLVLQSKRINYGKIVPTMNIFGREFPKYLQGKTSFLCDWSFENGRKNIRKLIALFIFVYKETWSLVNISGAGDKSGCTNNILYTTEIN